MKKFYEQIAAAFLLAGFMLGVKGDQLALWQEDDPEPVHIFSRRVSSLPLADQILLRRGVHAESESELTALLEDYL